jgi:hypothetical protein
MTPASAQGSQVAVKREIGAAVVADLSRALSLDPSNGDARDAMLRLDARRWAVIGDAAAAAGTQSVAADASHRLRRAAMKKR